MTFLAKLFGGGAKPAVAPPPSPKIGDAVGESAARELRARNKKRYGVDDTFLTGNLGQGGQAAPKQPRTMLG